MSSLVESDWFIALWGVAATLLVVTAAHLISIRRPPRWATFDQLAPQWSLITWSATMSSVALAVITYFVFSDFRPEFRGLASFGAGAIGFIFVQTIFTDFKLRYADRRIMRLFNLPLAVAGFAFLHFTGQGSMLVIYAVYLIVATAIIFLPNIGDSDGRALQTMVLAVTPVAGADGLTVAVVGTFVAVLTFAIVSGVKSKKPVSKMFTKAVSLPLVPLILGPSAIAVMAAPLYI